MSCSRRNDDIVSILLFSLHLLDQKQKCSICSFQKRTSEVQLALLERVEVGQGVPDELRGEPHLGN